MTRTALVLIVIVMAAVPTSAGAQSPGTTTPPPKASATVSGVVIDAQTQAPVRNAAVRINPSESASGGRIAVSDAQGRFEIAGLIGGSYVLAAARADYLPPALGQRRLGSADAILELAEGETRTGVIVPMERGGVITGRVVDDYGDPVPGIQVFALQPRPADADSSVRPVTFPATTDDRGVFRLFMLPPGPYYVLARQDVARAAGAERSAGPVSTYFPGSVDVENAATISVASGREASANIVLRVAKLTELRGRVLDAAGTPIASATVLLSTRLSGIASSTPGVATQSDGTFEIRGVAAGAYVLTAQRTAPDHERNIEKGVAEVSVAGEPIDDIVITASRGGSMRGIITTESGDPVPLPPAAFAIRLVAAAGERGGSMRGGGVDENYRFDLAGLFGRHRLDVVMQGVTGHWAVKAIRRGGVDVTNEFFSFQDQAIDGVEIVLSDRWATLSGIARSGDARPAGDAPLVLFPVDETLRIPDSRYIRGMRTDREGRFGISWLLPGEYLLASPVAMEDGQWNDVAFLERLEGTAIRVTLSDDEEQSVEIRIGRAK